MPATLPAARIRTQLMVPLRFADGYATTARVFTFDGLVEVITKKTRTALVRERLVPELVRAETSLANAACAGGACALPKGWSQWIRLGLGVLAMLAIPKMLAPAAPHEPVSMTVVAQWSFAGFVIFATTLSQTKKRHKQLVAAR